MAHPRHMQIVCCIARIVGVRRGKRKIPHIVQVPVVMSLKSYGEMSVLGEDVVKIAFRKFVIHIYITKPHKIG